MKNHWRKPTEAEIKVISNMKKASLGDNTKLKNWTIAFALYCVLVVVFYIFVFIFLKKKTNFVEDRNH